MCLFQFENHPLSPPPYVGWYIYELMTYFSHYLYKNVNNTQCEDDNLIMFCGITILFEKKYPIDFFVTTFISDFRHGGNNITLHHFFSSKMASITWLMAPRPRIFRKRKLETS